MGSSRHSFWWTSPTGLLEHSGLFCFSPCWWVIFIWYSNWWIKLVIRSTDEIDVHRSALCWIVYIIVLYWTILPFKAHKKAWKKRLHSSPVRPMTCPKSRPQPTTRQWPTARRPLRGSRTVWTSGWSSLSRSSLRASRWGRKQTTLDPELSSTTGRNACHASTTSWIRSKGQMWRLCWVSCMPPNPSSSRYCISLVLHFVEMIGSAMKYFEVVEVF